MLFQGQLSFRRQGADGVKNDRVAAFFDRFDPAFS